MGTTKRLKRQRRDARLALCTDARQELGILYEKLWRRHGRTDAEIADRCNRSLITVYQWKRGMTEPRVSDLVKMAAACRCHPAAFLLELSPRFLELGLEGPAI